jgi:hypothetical protein
MDTTKAQTDRETRIHRALVRLLESVEKGATALRDADEARSEIVALSQSRNQRSAVQEGDDR